MSGRPSNIPAVRIMATPDGSDYQYSDPSYGHIRYNTTNMKMEVWDKQSYELSGRFRGVILDDKDVSFSRIGEFTDGSGITFLNEVSFNDNVDISGNLTVFGDVSFNDVDISGNLTVLGDVSFASFHDLSASVTDLDLKKVDNGCFHFSQTSSHIVLTEITIGNPVNTGHDLSGEFDYSWNVLSISNVNGSADAVCLDFSIVGEWTSKEFEKGIVIARYKKGNTAQYFMDDVLQGVSTPTTDGGNSVRFIQPFTLSYYHANQHSTLESCCGRYVDTTMQNGKIYKYTIVCVNSSTHTANFFLNRTVGMTNPFCETGVSCFTAQEFYN